VAVGTDQQRVFVAAERDDIAEPFAREIGQRLRAYQRPRGPERVVQPVAVGNPVAGPQPWQQMPAPSAHRAVAIGDLQL